MESKNRKGLTDWIKAHSKSSDDTTAFQEIWKATESYQQSYQPDESAGSRALQDRMAAGRSAKTVPMRRGSRLLQIAASVAVLAIAGYAAYPFIGPSPVTFETVETGKNAAKNLQLEDGTSVALNGQGKLTFPAHFTKKERSVSLDGEAFFEVVKDADRPFVISTENVDIQVLGTSFNVRDFTEGMTTEVFVKTGKVAVTVKAANQRYTLRPGQILVFEKQTGKTDLKLATAENPIAWNTRVLQFKDTPLVEIFTEIERIFEVKFEIENKELADCPFTTTVRAAKLQDALDAIEASCDLNFSVVKPGQFKVTGQCCR